MAPLTSSSLAEVFAGDCEHLAGAAQCFLGTALDLEISEEQLFG